MLAESQVKVERGLAEVSLHRGYKNSVRDLRGALRWLAAVESIQGALLTKGTELQSRVVDLGARDQLNLDRAKTSPGVSRWLQVRPILTPVDSDQHLLVALHSCAEQLSGR